MHLAFDSDVRVIQQQGHLQVLAQRAEVLFPDHSTIGLHPVAIDGMPMMFLRALRHEGLRWYVFDLRRLGAPEIEADLLRLQPRDAQGCVYFTLRGLFTGAAAFGAAVVACSHASWWQDVADRPGAADASVEAMAS